MDIVSILRLQPLTYNKRISEDSSHAGKPASNRPGKMVRRDRRYVLSLSTVFYTRDVARYASF